MAKDNIDVPPSKRSINIGELMRNIGQPLTTEWFAAIESACSTIADLEAKSYPPTMKRMLRMAGRMETSAEEFRSLLPALLSELGLEVPAGVIQEARAKGGRPPGPTEQTLEFLRVWREMGRTGNPTEDDLQAIACKIFQDKYIKAKRRPKRNMRNQIRARILDWQRTEQQGT